MRPGQLWAILVILFGLLSGSFGLGYRVQAAVNESKINRYEATIQDFRGIQTKERFLSLYLRYLIADSDKFELSPEERDKARATAREHYMAYVTDLLRKADDVKHEIDVTGLYLGKGGGKDASVKFGYDGSVWPVPPELGFAAKR